MILPIGTDHDGKRPAVAVGLLILANLAAFAAMRAGIAQPWADASGADITAVQAFVEQFRFDPRKPSLWQALTSLFVHDPRGLSHLLGNMLFLWVFGKPVESHLGFWRFLALYLASGLAACGGHWLLSKAPVIGASGAIFGVTGLFVAFFPRSHTRILVLIGLTIIAIPSLWLVILYALLDAYRLLASSSGWDRGGVAAAAHLGGLLFGVGSGVALLAAGFVPRGEWDLLYSLKQWRRRQAMRAALRGAEHGPWIHSHETPSRLRADGSAPPPPSGPAVALRTAVTSALAKGDSQAALQGYRALESVDPKAFLNVAAQLDLANRALQEGDAALAARAYRRFLDANANDPKSPEVRLLLALVLVRRLGERKDAIPLLDGLETALTDDGQRSLVGALRTELGP